MSFAWPALLFLLLIPAVALAWDLTHRRRTAISARPKILRAEAGAKSLKLSDFASPSLAVSAKPRYWLCAGLALAVVALARPQWGRIEEPVFDQSREILLAIDLSRSMLTPDIKPSRLDRAKLLIQSLLERLEGERVGLLVFAGTAFLQSPLSADYEILREFLPALGPEYLPEGGSNYGALLTSGIQAFSATNAADRFLVILSDGEATDDNWRAQLTELKNKNIRVIGLGVGTAAGAFIPDGAGGLVKDDRGAVVLSKLESGTLQELAQATGGTYRDAGTWVDLAGLVNETVDRGRKGEFMEKNTIRLVERFQWPLAIGLWCLLVSFCYEFPVRPRPRDVQLASGTPGTPGTPPRLNQTGPGAITAALLLFALWGFTMYPTLGFSAVVPGINSPNAAPAPINPEEPSPLAKIIGRIATLAQPSGRDWADLGRETVNWGGRLKAEQQTVPEGPIRDALAAVELGSKLDPKATDWAKLREELDALLKKPDDKEKEQDKQQQKDQNQDQQNKDQQKQEQEQQKSDQQKQDQSGDPQDQKKSDQKQEPEKKEQDSPEQQKPQGESAFGDMNQKQEPPPPPPEESTQKVGGAPERKEEQKEPDPALALPLQKLDQLRNQDSPAQLFQLMEGEKKSTKKTGKDW